MTDPYAPKSQRRTPERADAKNAVLVRLERLGAAADVIDEVATSWPPAPEIVDYLLTSTDNELRAELERIEAEYAYATRTEEEQQALDDDAHRAAVAAEVAVQLAGPVSSVVDWIGPDPVKAAAALEFETSKVGQDRKGVREYCEKVLRAAYT